MSRPVPSIQPTPKSRSESQREPSNAVYCLCGAWWTGLRACHCAGEFLVGLQLLSFRDCHAKMLTKRYAHVDEAPVDGTGIMPHNYANLLTTKASMIQSGRPTPPLRSMFSMMLGSSHRNQVGGMIVSPVPITMMNMLIGYDETREDPMLIGFDVLPLADTPTQTDIPMVTGVTTRLIIGNALTRSKLANIAVLGTSFTTTLITASTLSSTCNLGTAIHTDNDRHDVIVLIGGNCHQTFTGLHAFNKHRAGLHTKTRYCLDPESVDLVDAGRSYPCWGSPDEDTRWGQ